METYDRPNRVLLSRSSLFNRVVNDQVKENVITSQGAADFAAALEMDKQLFIHELHAVSATGLRSSKG